jgi:RNA polymerase sigma-70 factor (ECF subfamily)
MNDAKRLDLVTLLGPLRRYARSLTRDPVQAEDLVQDALVRAYDRRATFRTGGSPRGWLLSVLHNTFIDHKRRHTADLRLEQQIAQTAPVSSPPEQESGVRLRQISQAFLLLPEEQRAALHLVAIEGLSYQEAAQALGTPVGTIMSRVGRARAALRAFEAGDTPRLMSADKPRPNLRIVGGSHD